MQASIAGGSEHYLHQKCVLEHQPGYGKRCSNFLKGLSASPSIFETFAVINTTLGLLPPS